MKRTSNTTIFCLQEVNPEFCKVIVSAFSDTMHFVYGHPEPLPNPCLDDASTSQQGNLILSPFEIENPTVLYPFLDFPRPPINPPTIPSAWFISPYANPIVCAKIHGIDIINTHYIAGGQSSLKTPFIFRDLQTAKIIEYLFSLPLDAKIFFCSDFNRYISNYTELFTSSGKPLTLRSSTDINPPENRNGSVLRVFGNQFLMFEKENTMGIINAYLLKNNIMHNGKVLEITPTEHNCPKNVPKKVLDILKEQDLEFYLKYFYVKAKDEGYSIEGVWTNFKNVEVIEQSVEGFPTSEFYKITGTQRFGTDEEINEKGNPDTLITLPIYPTLHKTGCPSDHLPITAIITEGAEGAEGAAEGAAEAAEGAKGATEGGNHKKTKKRYTKYWGVRSSKYGQRRYV